jgi:hypothetical protein
MKLREGTLERRESVSEQGLEILAQQGKSKLSPVVPRRAAGQR